MLFYIILSGFIINLINNRLNKNVIFYAGSKTVSVVSINLTILMQNLYRVCKIVTHFSTGVFI